MTRQASEHKKMHKKEMQAVNYLSTSFDILKGKFNYNVDATRNYKSLWLT